MTYKLNPILRIFDSPVKVLFPDNTIQVYSSGEDAAQAVFDRLYKILRITANGNSIVIQLEERQLEAVEDPFT